MKEESSKVSFWAYDIFGYLLPGLVLIAGFAKSNQWVYENIHKHWSSGSYADYAIILGIAYTIGHIVSGLSSFILERLLLRHILKYPTQQMFKESDNTSKYIKLFFPGYFRPYSKGFQKSVKDKIKKEFDIEPSEEHDIFWLSWSFVCANHPVAYKRATHFLELYGFSRNMSMSFLMLVPSTWFASWTNTINGYFWSLGALFAAWILFVNYTKLLRRLNDEVYRAFVVSKQ
jgi:hypothetical protein